MKNRQAAAILLAMVMATGTLAGCSSSGGSSTDTAAAEETTEETTDEETEETAEAEDSAADEAAGDETEEFIPDDFVQERAGVNEFDDYDDVIRYLEGNEGYAYIGLDGSSAMVLAVSDQLTDDNEATDVCLYAYNSDGKLTNVGNAFSVDASMPIRSDGSTLYVCGDTEYSEMKISEETGGLFYTRVIDMDKGTDGTVSFSGFVRENDDINESSEEIGVSTEEEFQALFTAIEDVEPIHFNKAEYDSYDAAVSSLKSGDGYAYLTIDGYDGEILAITDYIYQWDNGENASITAYLYEEKDGKAQFVASVLDGGTNYPIRVENGVLYATGHAKYGEMTIAQDESGRDCLTYTKYAAISYDADQNPVFETAGDVTVTTEDEFYALYDTVSDMAPVDFQTVD